METKYTVMTRAKVLVNTDPQRRCYNGAFASYRMDWGPWESLHSGLTKEKADDQLKFWIELNDYAVSQRGEDSRREFKIVPNNKTV